ncbi:MAG TPA: DUF1552 domain-containing protein [Vicinamibacterales bacterium]|nr:DUF1552 domain-containing protein [Vicinamibacterales bacterium]
MSMKTSPLQRNPRELSRRRFLRGTGVVMALPWLESLAVWGAEPASAAAAPRRLAILFMGNGVNPTEWWAQESGAGIELGRSLAPMQPLKGKFNYIKGLFNKAATGVGIHPGMTGNLLSGAPLTKGAELHGGVSLDQVLAAHIGDQTVQPSMVLGCEQPVTGYHETNFSMAYSSHISWSTPTSPVPMEVYPSLAFDSLFENRGSQRNLSVLDRVRDQIASLGGRVSAADKGKLDEYLTSVRDVERRAQDMRAAQEKAEANAANRGRVAAMMPRPDNGLPEDIRDHMRLMCDILALAFQTDKTRIATLLLCRDISGLFYPFLDVKLAHHLASHEDTSDAFMRVNQFYLTQYAYLIDKLAAMPEGDSTVLNNSCLVFMSNMWSGSQHDSTKVPVLTAGTLGGTLETGRVLDYTNAGDENRKLCSFYLSLMDRMGVKLDRFGDATEHLAGI